MLALPAVSSPVRALVDVEFLATLGDTAQLRKLPTFREALNRGRAHLAAEPAAKSLNVVTLRANGELWLVTVTRKAWRRRWNFGRAV